MPKRLILENGPCAVRAAIAAALLDPTAQAKLPAVRMSRSSLAHEWSALLTLHQQAKGTKPRPTCSAAELVRLRAQLCQVAAADTAYDGASWEASHDRLAEHCKAASWVVQQLYGGVLLYRKTAQGDHYWNLLPCGTMVDLTGSQFQPPLAGDGLNPVIDPTHVLPPAKSAHPRFKLLFKRFNAL